MNSNEGGDMSFNNRLQLCILSGDNEEAQRILRDMDPCNMIDSSRKTLLHVAAESENVTIARYLIDRGCKVDAVDNNKNTPLTIACQKKHADVVVVLIEAKASVLIPNNEGKSTAEIVLGGTEFNVFILDPVIERVKEEYSNDSLRMAKEFVRIGCSLTRALRLKDVEITKYMLENGCNINDQDHQLQGWTPLHQALVFKDNENAKLLIDRGANVNVVDASGGTPLCYVHHFDILEILLNKGARIVDDNGTLIAESLFSDWGKQVIEMLITRYSLTDLSIRDRDGTTLFYHLVSNRSSDLVEILQKHFHYAIDINEKDQRGFSALISAVRAGNVGTVEFLLKRGAKFHTSETGKREIFFALIRNAWRENREDREKIMMVLLQYGADIQWAGRDSGGNEYGTLDCVLRKKHFAMAKIILARLALIEDLGVEIKTVYRNEIDRDAMFKKYFQLCKRTIEKLKRVVIKRRVTLFDFLTCSEETLVKFARSEEFVATVQLMLYHKRHSNLYYYKVLRQRVKKAVKIMDLREGMSLYVNHLIPELQSNQIVIEKIVEYIIHDILGLMAKQPTFKCEIDNK